MTAAKDRFIRLHWHLREIFTTATSTVSAIHRQHRISDQTVRNCLRDSGIRPRRPVKATVLKSEHRRNRLQWDLAHRVWHLQLKRPVWFSDEFLFLRQRADDELVSSDVKMNVLLLIASRKWKGSVAEALWCGEPYQSLTGPISCTFKGLLRLSAFVTKFYRQMSFQLNGANFQHDNIRPNTARLTYNFLQNHNLQVLPWPSESPDVNLIMASQGWFGQARQVVTSTAAVVATCSGTISRVEKHSSTDNTQFDCLSGKTLPGYYWRSWWTHKILNLYGLDIKNMHWTSNKIEQ